MFARLPSLLLKEFIQFFRDRLILVLILWLYTIEVVICGYALSFDVREVPLAVLDRDNTALSRSLVRELVGGGAFRLAGRLTGNAQAERWLETGRATVVVVIPERFSLDIARDGTTAIQALIDGANSNTAAIGRGYLLEIVRRFEQQQGWTEAPAIRPVVRVWYNPGGTFTSFIVLSMIALAALMVGVIHPAASIVREKEVGTIEQLRVTPITAYELFIAKTTPTLVIGLLSVFPSLLIAWWFGVPLRGSLSLFLALTGLFLFSAIGIGALVASICRSQQQALLLSFFGLFPIMFLSGTLVPIEAMPDFLQYLSLASPLRYYMDVILGIFMKGAGFDVLWPQALALALIGTALYILALGVFRARPS